MPPLTPQIGGKRFTELRGLATQRQQAQQMARAESGRLDVLLKVGTFIYFPCHYPWMPVATYKLLNPLPFLPPLV